MKKRVVVIALGLALIFVAWMMNRSAKSPLTVKRTANFPVLRAPDDCTYAQQCEGSTERVEVPAGYMVCFDPPIFSDPNKFGFMISPDGISEHPYPCSLEGVANGSCKQEIKAFRFAPLDGKTPPRHWFIKMNGDITC